MADAQGAPPLQSRAGPLVSRFSSSSVGRSGSYLGSCSEAELRPQSQRDLRLGTESHRRGATERTSRFAANTKAKRSKGSVFNGRLCVEDIVIEKEALAFGVDLDS